MAFTPPSDSATELKPFVPPEGQAEELTPDTAMGSFLRGAKSKISSGVGGLLGAVGGAALAGPESGFMLSVPAGMAGAAGGSALGQGFYRSMMGEEGMKREEAQLEANRLAGHGFAGGAGEMLPSLLPAAAAPTRAAGSIGRVANAAESGLAMGAAGEAAHQVDTGKFDPAALATKPLEDAVKFGPVGLIPHAEGILKSIAKGIPDAAVMTLSSNLYDHYVHGKPLSLEGYKTETGEAIPSFLLLNAITSVLSHGKAGAKIESTPESSSQAPEKEGYTPAELVTQFKEPQVDPEAVAEPTVGPVPQKVTEGAFLPSAEGKKEIIYPTERKHLEEVDQDAFMQQTTQELPDQELLDMLAHVDQHPNDPKMVAFGDLLHEEGVNRGIIDPQEAPVGPFPEAPFGRAPQAPEPPLDPMVPTPPLAADVELNPQPEQGPGFVQDVTQPPTTREAFKYANRPLAEREPERAPQSNSEGGIEPPMSPPSGPTKTPPSISPEAKNALPEDVIAEHQKTKDFLEIAKRVGASKGTIEHLEKQLAELEKKKQSVVIPGETKAVQVPVVSDGKVKLGAEPVIPKGEPVLAPTTLAATEKAISQAPEKPIKPKPSKSNATPKRKEQLRSKPEHQGADEKRKEAPEASGGNRPSEGRKVEQTAPADGSPPERVEPEPTLKIKDYNTRGELKKEVELPLEEARKRLTIRKATFDLLKRCIGA